MAKCALLVINFVCWFCTLSASEFILPSENKLRVQINWPGSVQSGENEDQRGDVIYMTSVDHEKYKCILPPSKNDDEDNENQNSEDLYKGETPLELLKPIFSQLLCAIKIESFWVYELCHGYHIRQFHEENSGKGKIKLQYSLGKFDLEAAFAEERLKFEENQPVSLPTVQVGDAQLPYFAINMTDGTFCEIGGKKRFTRVLYVCSLRGNNAMYSLKETSSCEYEVIVLTTVLCVHPAFRKKFFTEAAIHCHPVDGSPNKPKRLDKLELAAKPEPFKPFYGTATLEEEDEEEKDKEEMLETVSKNLGTAKISEKKEGSPHDEKLIEDVLQGRYCLRGGSGWWRYEFCYGKQVKQYHINNDGTKTTVLLGIWNIEKHMSWLEQHPTKKPKKDDDLKQISHFYSDGDFCDEAKKFRQVEIKLKCKEVLGHPDSVSLFLREPKTCEYILTVESPVFCSLLKELDVNGLTPELH